MASCSKCDNSTFEAQPINVKHLNVQIIAICCTSCHSVVGTFDVVTHDKVKAMETVLKR